MKKIILSIIFYLMVMGIYAQSITKEVVAKCPELMSAKVYTGEDVKKTKNAFPNGVYVRGYGNEKNYPFGKVTGKKSVLIFAFEDPYEGEIIYMHAYTYRLKDYSLINSQSYVFNEGKINGTTYQSTLKINNDQEVFIKTSENDKTKTGKYLLNKKGFQFEEWIYD